MALSDEDVSLYMKSRDELVAQYMSDGVGEEKAKVLADVELVRRMEAEGKLRPQEKEKPDFGTCKVVYMQGGQPKECGGKLKLVEIHKPFDEFTPIGGSYRSPVIDSFIECQKCKVRKST